MKNRLSKLSRQASLMLIVLAACGMTSCEDEYKLDDEKPGWLSASLYESLQNRGNFTYYLRLLDDPDVNPKNARPLTEVLSQTGSKTLFVANDDAWNEFFQQNALLADNDPWHTATSYENLSVNQKKLLIHTSMLNNAIVMENLASSEGTSGERGQYMRRYTDVEITDSVMKVTPEELPISYNEEIDPKTNKECEVDYWKRFRTEEGGNGIYLVADSTKSMMLFFTNEFLANNAITDEDFKIISGQPRVTEDVHVYGSKVLEKDIVTENGYINITEKVIKPLPNMAEVLRTSGETKIFSHMIDRYSVPTYNAAATESYRILMESLGLQWGSTDSIFSKRYFNYDNNNSRHSFSKLYGAPSKFSYGSEESNMLLKFDPGWNEYNWNQPNAQHDIAAMYIPNDETLWKYFSEGGGGWQLIQTYCDPTVTYSSAHTPEDYNKLFRNIDQIPIPTLTVLLNVMMFPSFVSSVPSKYAKQKDDAFEQMFYAEDMQHIQKVLLANNGVIYLMDKVYGPADYTSVAGPANLSKDKSVMKWAIYNGNGDTDYMGLNYYAYLKAMRSRFALFLPNDDAMYFYYDPVSFCSKKQRVVHFFTKSGTGIPIDCESYHYDNATGAIEQKYASETLAPNEIVNRLKDILESHTLVLENVDEINTGIDEYYLAKNGSAVKVTRANDENGKPHVVKVQGGFQLENEENGITGMLGTQHNSKEPNVYPGAFGVDKNLVIDEHNMANGTTYIIDSPIVPTSRSVYNIFTNAGTEMGSGDFGEFYSQCNGEDDIIRACGLVDQNKITDPVKQERELSKYRTFINDYGADFNVQFFNNFRYTIFVPTNDAMLDAIGNGLPTWESIRETYEAMEKNPEDNTLTNKADSVKLQGMITYLVNFIRYHFADESVFVDKSDINPTDFVTSSYDNKRGLFNKIYIKRENGNLMVQDLVSADPDETGAIRGNNWQTITGRHNIMARDFSCINTAGKGTSPAGLSSLNGIAISGSSFAVIHQVPTVLYHAPIPDWNDTSAVKNYIKRYAIH